MPANVSALLSTGVSVGIIAGVVSGIFYLVVAGFRWAGEVRLHSSDWLSRRFLTSSSDSQDNRGHGSIMESESSQVRDFIERLVESLVAGNLDHVNVNRLYTHPDYKPLDDCDSPSSAHSELKQLVQRVVQEAMTLPSLRKVSENGTCNGTERVKDVDLKTYEDILATAILNKVIQRFQQCSLGTDGNCNLLHKTGEMEQQQTFISCMDLGASTSSKSSRMGDYEASTASLHDVRWSDNSQGEPSSFTLEDCLENDNDDEEVTSYPSSEEGTSGRGAELDFYLSGLNFIKRHRVPFPELGMDLVDGNEPRGETTSPEPTDLMSPGNSWEENWLFQRRKLKVGGSLQSMPVPMLVPNPSEDFRALIGDQDAEDTSDLSDSSEGIYEGLLDAQKTSVTRVDLSEDGIMAECMSLTEMAGAMNLDVCNGVDSSSEFGQLDSEYTEDYASVTQLPMTRDDEVDETPSTRPVPKPRTTAPAEVTEDLTAVNGSNIPEGDIADNLASPPRPGTIAEREHKKWESAAPLPNNPYSSENIMKRLNKSSLFNIRPVRPGQVDLPGNVNSSESEKVSSRLPSDANITRYGRDYYVNASKSSNGRNHKRPIEIVTLPTETSRPETKSVDQPEVCSPRVGNCVTQWQTEINQRDEVWRKNNSVHKKDINPQKVNNYVNKLKEKNGLPNGHTTNLLQDNKEIIIIEKPTESKLMLSDTILLATVVASQESHREIMPSLKSSVNGSTSVGHRKINTNCVTVQSNVNNSKSVQVCESKQGTANVVNGSGAKDKMVNKSAAIVMPSVKDLAKQFTERTDIVDTPQTSIGGNHIPSSTQKKALYLNAGQPTREVHSLTARSISREFREELRRNLPTPRNTANISSHTSSSDIEVKATPGYKSDEGFMRNNIAFWEQMRHK